MPLTRLRMDELVNAWVGDRNTPFQIGLLATFEPGPFLRPGGVADTAAVARELAVRATAVPRLAHRVRWTRPGEGLPCWVEDPDDSAARHVSVAHLPPGTDLATWAANRTVVPLDRNRPLWRADVVGGLPGGRFAVLLVMHHLLVDGRAGVRMLGRLLDDAPDVVRPPPPEHVVPPLPRRRDLVRDRRRRRRPGAPRPSLRGAVAAYRTAMADLSAPLPPTSLPRRVGPTRRLAVVSADLAAVRALGRPHGGTVNDVLLAAVTEGVRDLLLARGECRPGVFVRTIVPVAADPVAQAIGMMVLDLPVDEPDREARLATVVERTGVRKRRLREQSAPRGLLDVPAPLARVVLPWARRRGSARVHLSVTGLPGPPGPLWLAGARLLTAVPVAPLVPRVGLSVAALSYDGRLAVGVVADGSVRDLPVLARGMATSLGPTASTGTP